MSAAAAPAWAAVLPCPTLPSICSTRRAAKAAHPGTVRAAGTPAWSLGVPGSVAGGGLESTHYTAMRALIDYLGSLTMTGGDRDGEPFTVLPWESRFIRGAFRVKGPAAVSLGRGNGKSALVAGIATAVADPEGPLHGRRREAVAVASSFDQSRIIFEDVLAFLRERHDLSDRKVWRVQDSANRAVVEYRGTGARVRCVGSDPAKAHGLRPFLALCDEPAQWDGAKQDRMLAAIKTGMGKVPGSKMIALGTRPADSEHWFAKMLAGGAAYAQCHAARPDDPRFHLRTWRRANPSLDHLPSLVEEIRDEASAAKQDESLLAGFEALRLNMGTSDSAVAVLIGAALWRDIEGEAERSGPLVWGIDLGTSAAQSAVAGFWPETGALACMAAFPDSPSLAARGLHDGVGNLYTECARRGELIQTPGRATHIPTLLETALARFGRPALIVSDRWREAELRDSLDAAGVPAARLEVRGMGYRDGAEDVRSFRRACAEKKVVPQPSLLLRSAMAEARTISDPAGNSKLSKGTQGGRRLRARDDAAAAAILAVSAGCRTPVRTPRPARFFVAGAA